VITHAQLDHPNIIQLHGVFYDNPEAPPMMVLPLVEKGSLADLIATELLSRALNMLGLYVQGSPFVKPCPHTTSLKATGIGRALVYLHLRKPPIYHGDIHLVKHKS
jgi:serine/threonine protein kinase